MFQKMSDSFQRFMAGRNGADALSWTLLVAGLVLNIIASATGWSVLSIFTYLLLILAVFRMFSRNVSRRAVENQTFLSLFTRFKAENRTYRYYRCPACKKQVRVPRGKGKIRITCPECHEQFIKKT